MDQVFEGTPQATLRLEGRKVVRGEVTHDWGSRLQWNVRRDGKTIATPLARLAAEYEHTEVAPGMYEVSLEMWKYDGYQNGCLGKYVTISNTVRYKI